MITSIPSADMSKGILRWGSLWSWLDGDADQVILVADKPTTQVGPAGQSSAD